MQTISSATLWPFFAIALLFAGCKKDITPPRNVPSLTIEEAKQLFQSKIPSTSISREDSTELEFSVVPDWDNAVSYFDQAKQQSVVEVPLLEGIFSRYLINPGNATVDTAAFFQSPQNVRLIVVRDSLGVTDYAIMKINGTYSYNNTPGAFLSNTYHQMDSLFEGVVHYVDIYDHTRDLYYVSGGQFYQIDSIRAEGLNQNIAQDRWEIICIKYHSYQCNCLDNPSNPTYYWTTFEVCYEVFSPTFPTPLPPPYIPNPNDPNNGQSGTGTTNNYQNNAICFMQNVSAFDSGYGLALLNDYEEEAFACNSGCSGTLASFESCVQNGLIGALVANNPEISLTPEERSWLKNHFKLYAEIQKFLALNGSNSLSQKMMDDLIYLAARLNLTTEQAKWLTTRPLIAQGVAAFQSEYQGFDGADMASRLYLNYLIDNNINDPSEGDFADYGENVASCAPCFVVAFSQEYAFLKREHPGSGIVHDAKLQAWATWNVLSNGVHLLLDGAGLIPVVGEVADLVSGGIYLLEGEYVDASLSFSATIPFGGWVSTGTKYARKITTINGKSTTLNMAVENGIIKFGNDVYEGRGQLRRALNTPAGHEAHHIIPWELREHPVVQAAASVGNNSAFHMNDILNGISLPNSLGSGLPQHLGSHPDYTERVRLSLNAIEDFLENNNNMSPNNALEELTTLVGKINTKISTTSGGTINAVSGW